MAKKKRKKKKTMRERAELYLTWFDSQRDSFVRNNEHADTIGDALRNFKDFSRRVMIAKAVELLSGGRVIIEAKQLAEMTGDEVDLMNGRLPLPLPDGDDPLVAVGDLLEKYGHLRDVDSQHYTKERGMASCLLGYMDIVGTCVGFESVMAEDGELMMVDAGLAAKIIKSKNQPISGEDLEHIPFSTTTLEFSEPIPLIGKLEARAVSFLTRKKQKLRSVIWHFNNVQAWNGTFGLESMMIEMHFGHWSKFVVDSEVRRLAGLPDLADEMLQDGDAKYVKFFNKMQVMSMNVWDFVTCRNIDYEECPRKGTPREKPKHVSKKKGKHSPRKFRIIRINKKIRKGGGGAPFSTNFEFAVRIPAMWHKWVYCRNCGRVHRNDLVGHPCRRCKVAVGPFSNIEMRKHWHDEYWVGEGEAEDTVWGVRER